MTVKRAAILPVLILLMLGDAAGARESLGVYGSWGAFRDRSPKRCFAIAEPEVRGRKGIRPFASIASWPAQKTRNQLHIRTARAMSSDRPITLQIGDQRFKLLAGRFDAWAPARRIDAAIIAAIRSHESMLFRAYDERGKQFSDRYLLRGAATAIDAAALACAR